MILTNDDTLKALGKVNSLGDKRKTEAKEHFDISSHGITQTKEN